LAKLLAMMAQLITLQALIFSRVPTAKRLALGSVEEKYIRHSVTRVNGLMKKRFNTKSSDVMCIIQLK